MSSSIGVGGGLALPGAALVAQNADWHALFFGAAGLGVLSMLLTLFTVPESARRAPGRFDKTGAFGLSAGLVALLLPVTKGSDWGWASPTTLGLFGAAVVILLAWGAWELRSAAPLVDLRTTARREVLLTNLTSVMVGVAFYAISLVLPQLLQLPSSTGYGLGKSMVVAGLCVAPLGLTMMLTAPLYARIASRRGPKVSLIIGMVIIAIGYGGGLGLMSAAWQTIIISVVVGAGIGLAYSSLPALIIGAVDASETGAANGLNTLMRSIGTSVSSAVIGMVLARTATETGGVALPTMHGFRISFVIATVAVLGGLVLAAFLPGQRAAAAAGPATGAHAEADSGTVADLRAAVVAELGADRALTDADAGLAAMRQAAASGAHASPHTTLLATSGGFRGRVTGADGLPVARATITLIDRRGAQAGRAVADADGWYDLVPPGAGDFVIAGSASGHGSQARSAAYAGDGVPVEVDLALPAPHPAVRESDSA
jgi:MFS family permease